MFEVRKLTGTTSAGGAATITDTISVNGLLYAVEWVDGDLANNNTCVLSATGTPSGVDQALHSQGAAEGGNPRRERPRGLSIPTSRRSSISDTPRQAGRIW